MPILVATAVAARGLDIPNVMHVVKYVIYFSCSICYLFFSVYVICFTETELMQIPDFMSCSYDMPKELDEYIHR